MAEAVRFRLGEVEVSPVNYSEISFPFQSMLYVIFSDPIRD